MTLVGPCYGIPDPAFVSDTFRAHHQSLCAVVNRGRMVFVATGTRSARSSQALIRSFDGPGLGG